MGLHVLRVPNGLVLEDPEAFRRKVCEAVGGDAFVESSSPGASRHPLPLGERVEAKTKNRLRTNRIED
jgi:hypothetical protein